jgi:hypothetical protein
VPPPAPRTPHRPGRHAARSSPRLISFCSQLTVHHIAPASRHVLHLHSRNAAQRWPCSKARHACDPCPHATEFWGNHLPCPDHVGDFRDRGLSQFHRQAEKLCRVFERVDGTRTAVEIDGGPQDDLTSVRSDPIYRPDRPEPFCDCVCLAWCCSPLA